MESKKVLVSITMQRVKLGMDSGRMERELTGFLKKNSRTIKTTNKIICNTSNDFTDIFRVNNKLK